MWSKKLPLPLPKGMPELGVPSLPANCKSCLTYNLVSRMQREQEGQSQAPHIAPLSSAKPSSPNPSEMLCPMFFCGGFQTSRPTLGGCSGPKRL